LIANLIEPSDGRLLWWRGDFGRVGQDGRRFAFVFQEPTLLPWPELMQMCGYRLNSPMLRRPRPPGRGGGDRACPVCPNLPGTFRASFPAAMKMRVSIARALVTNPNLLLMDEPSGRLTNFTRNRLDADLVQLWWERKLTTVFVTHSIYEAVFLSTRIIVMAANPGRIFRTMTSTSHSRATSNFVAAPSLRLTVATVELACRSLPSLAIRRHLVKPLLQSEAFVQIAAPVAVGVMLIGVWKLAADSHLSLFICFRSRATSSFSLCTTVHHCSGR